MFLDEVLLVLVAANVGVFNTSLFISSKAQIPPPPAVGPFMTLVATGGTLDVTHNTRSLPAYVKNTLQLFTRGNDYPTSQAMLLAALAALYPIRNQLVAGVWWLSVTPLQAEPIDLGQDDNGRINLSLNFIITRRPNAALSS